MIWHAYACTSIMSADFACRVTPQRLVLVAAVALGGLALGAGKALAAASAAWLAWTAYLLAQQPQENLGHRAGVQGFSGEEGPCPAWK